MRHTLLATLRRIVGLDTVRQPGIVIVEQIKMALRLQSVALLSQVLGVIGLEVFFWNDVPHSVLVVWCGLVAAEIYGWLDFRRRFLRDPRQAAHIRRWLRHWFLLSVITGIVWGLAGYSIQISDRELGEIVLVAVIVGVVFSWWPAFSCWLPSLTVVTVLSFTPLVIGLAAEYDFGRAGIAIIVLIVTGFVLYCGRCVNENAALAVVRNQQNTRLVEKLKAEKLMAENARKATVRASERRARFFAGANHDLRQPLQALGIYLQIFEMQARGTDRELIAQLKACAQNISSLVETILEVSRIEAGNLEVRLENVQVRTIFERLDQEFRPVAADKRLIFETRPIDAIIETDPEIVCRILRNLITNAIHYTERIGGRIILSAKRRSDRIVLAVYDEGVGIEPEERQKIYEAFYRGAAGKKSHGYGLGLSIVRGLAQRLSVPVTLGSRPGRGSVFRVTFAEKVDAVLPADTAVKKPEAVEALHLDGVVGLLEDNDTVRKAVEAMLRSWGASVISAREMSDEFYERLTEAHEKGQLRAFISDYNLGSESATGLEAIFMLLGRIDSHIPCVLLTAVAVDEIQAKFREIVRSEPDAQHKLPMILQKPATAQSLMRVIRQAMR